MLIALPIILAILVFYLTKDQPKEYVSSTRVYTGITTGSSIVSLESSKVDLFATRTAFDNLLNVINSRSTIEDAGLRLLATHLMLDEPDPEIISAKSFENLNEIVPQSIRDEVVKGDIDATFENLNRIKNSGYDNFIYKLINYDHPHYSSKKIASKIRVRRVQSSDMIDITYTSSDPGICKGTLEILTDVFINNYTQIKVNQSDAVVKYFEKQLDQSNEKLNEAETELLNFNRNNVIINYYEQTKAIAAEKQLFQMRYLEIKLENAGSKAVLEALENKMSIRQREQLNNDTISTLRHELAQVNLDIALKSFEQEVDTAYEAEMIQEIGELRMRAYEIQQELRSSVQEQYYIDNSTKGIATQSIMEDWVDNVVEFESSLAQLHVAQLREQEFIDLFESYAPLGATMKRLERKIDVAEREYLSLLHSLGVAKLNQQNIELTSNLKIVAEPLFPIVPQPSKRKFLIAVAFMIGFIIPAFVIIVLEFLDQNLKTAVRAEKKTGLSVAAIFPKLIGSGKKIDIGFIKSRGLDIISRRLILNTENGAMKDRAETNVLFSILEEEGKTTIAKLLIEKLVKFGYRVLFITDNETVEVDGADTKYYSVDESFHRAESIEDIVSMQEDDDFDQYDYIFIEIPGVLLNTYPINIFKNTDHSFLITRANRAWSKADAYALDDILESTKGKKPQVILNGVELEEMETVLGDLPKKRSWIRRTLKNILKLQFFSKNKLIKN